MPTPAAFVHSTSLPTFGYCLRKAIVCVLKLDLLRCEGLLYQIVGSKNPGPTGLAVATRKEPAASVIQWNAPKFEGLVPSCCSRCARL
jgi:hypothetical protein